MINMIKIKLSFFFFTTLKRFYLNYQNRLYKYTYFTEPKTLKVNRTTSTA